MKPLSENQKEMLLRFFKGDIPEGTIEGYFWESAPEERVDGRTMKSLINRDLISARGYVSSGGFWSRYCSLTEQGKAIAEKFDEAAYQERRARRGW